jgi:hypothetical protein
MKSSPRLTAQVEAVLGVIDELVGKPIGGNDLLIAAQAQAQALALDQTLVTDDDQEFSRVDGLCVENWLRDLDILVAGALLPIQASSICHTVILK